MIDSQNPESREKTFTKKSETELCDLNLPDKKQFSEESLCSSNRPGALCMILCLRGLRYSDLSPSFSLCSITLNSV